MFKKIITLFVIARKLALSDALKIFSKYYDVPVLIKIILGFLSISFTGKKSSFKNLNEEERLCNSIQSMGTTFIKLGQFLATRPDIIGNQLSKQLEKLQDKLPAFSMLEAKTIIKKNLGDNIFNSIINLSEPIAAA